MIIYYCIIFIVSMLAGYLIGGVILNHTKFGRKLKDKQMKPLLGKLKRRK